MHLPDDLRDNLRKPLGILLREPEVTKENLLKHVGVKPFLISVGDATTEKLIKYGMTPSLQIVDSLEKRQKREIPEGEVKTSLSCSNPPAEVTDESIKVIKQSFSMPTPVRIIVKGEEDLLVLPVVLYGPDNSIVLYGQPNEGIVIVRITKEIRNKAREIMNLMS